MSKIGNMHETYFLNNKDLVFHISGEKNTDDIFLLLPSKFFFLYFLRILILERNFNFFSFAFCFLFCFLIRRIIVLTWIVFHANEGSSVTSLKTKFE